MIAIHKIQTRNNNKTKDCENLNIKQTGTGM